MKSKVVVKGLQILDRRNTIWDVVIQASVFRQRQGETDHPVGNDPNAGDKWEHLVSHHLGEALVTTTTPSSLILMNGKYHLHLTEVGNPHPHEPSLVWADARVIWNPSLLAPQPCWFIFLHYFHNSRCSMKIFQNLKPHHHSFSLPLSLFVSSGRVCECLEERPDNFEHLVVQ